MKQKIKSKRGFYFAIRKVLPIFLVCFLTFNFIGCVSSVQERVDENIPETSLVDGEVTENDNHEQETDSSWEEVSCPIDIEDKESGKEENEGEGVSAETESEEEQSFEAEETVQQTEPTKQKTDSEVSAKRFSVSDIDAYIGKPYVIVNGNQPYFSDEELTTSPFAYYLELDSLGRCGFAYANLCVELMPTNPRSEIGYVKPSGWKISKYDFVDGKYLYNRCHLIGYQLAGENDNIKNLITGTRYLNIQGMLPFENMVANYIRQTDNHVFYRVTPIFEGDNLLCSGVLMEAKSVEDKGGGICFNVFCYNVQPGVVIDYADGSNYSDGTQEAAVIPEQQSQSEVVEISPDSQPESVMPATSSIYVLNTNTKKFHYPECSSVEQMADQNRRFVELSREQIIADGYDPCKRCNP